ncbi:hypothetical protein [Paracoccus aminovorans]|nr:hypothetical protein [Paracoccus aminovorans]
MSGMQLYRRGGWSSAIVEMQLAHYGIGFEPVEVADLFIDQKARARR